MVNVERQSYASEHSCTYRSRFTFLTKLETMYTTSYRYLGIAIAITANKETDEGVGIQSRREWQKSRYILALEYSHARDQAWSE